MSLLTTLIEVQRQKEIHNLQEKLSRATRILQTKNEIETLDFALERVIKEFGNIDLQDDIASVFDLNYVKPKRVYEIEAEFEFIGRGKPLPFDFSDVNWGDED